MRRAAESANVLLAERLRERRDEIVSAALTRVRAISGPSRFVDPAYAEGLRQAVIAAVEYGLEGIEAGGGPQPAIPPALLAQARLAARNRVGIDVVLRRYLAGQALLGDFVLAVAEAEALGAQAILRSQAALFDRLLAAVSQEHRRELDSQSASVEQRRRDRVRRLLEGELIDTSALGYDFDLHHVGLLIEGPYGERVLEELARRDGRLLAVRVDGETVWAWLGSATENGPGVLQTALCDLSLTDTAVGLGESGQGLGGWRLTHRQASAALGIARRAGRAALHYSQVALLAAALHDDLLETSLRGHYLVPLRGGRDEGQDLRKTLRAYFAAQRSVVSAAASLGIDRHTVSSRLRSAEELIGRPIGECAGELELALRIGELEEGSAHKEDGDAIDAPAW